MIHLALIIILAQLSAPEIAVDQDGYVTVIESPEERAEEARNIDILTKAARAYNNYRNSREGNLEELIAQHAWILESDMELVPEARQMINNQLIELYRERATASLAISSERYREIMEHKGFVSAELFKDQEEYKEYIKYKEIELKYQEQLIEQLPEEDAIEAARQFYELALTAADTLEATNRQHCARYQGRSRQKALEAAQKEDLWQREALGLAETAGNFLLSELKQQNNIDLCLEFIEAYPNDKELVQRIEKLLSELTSL